MTFVKFTDLGKQYLILREEILAKFDEISKQGDYILSDEVLKFENNFAEYCGARFAVGVGNGSDALYLSLMSLGVGSGDEVITAPNSFIASASVIARTGGTIVFADVGYDMNIDPDRVEKTITKRTKAILPVHISGRVADMESLQAIADKYNLFIVEDAAQAVGARYKGKRAGTFGVSAGFSLHPLKNLHVHGDGGVITTNEDTLYKRLLKYRNHGLRNRDECDFWGVNSRLDSIQAGIANIKLKYLDRWNERFREIASFYSANLRDYVSVPEYHDYEEPVFHRYMIQCSKRDELKNFLARNGVETKVNYPIPIHLQKAAKALGYKKGDFPVVEKLSDSILSLPIYPEMEDEHTCYVIDKIIEYYKKI
jgi:dTDP-4-amino-4,6-dideoxygalactose transaminase